MSPMRRFQVTLTERAMLFQRSLNAVPLSHRQRITDGMSAVYPPVWEQHPCIYFLPVN